MAKTLRISFAALAVACLALSAASVASAQTLRGTVVHRNAPARSFTVASRRGHLSAVHASHLPRLGRAVRVRARRLRNGTYRALHVSSGHLRRRARLRGTVTYRRHARLFVVSARGVSLVVRPSHGRARASARRVPNLGHVVSARVRLRHGCLELVALRDHGEDSGRVELEGVVQSVDVAGALLTLSADDEDLSGGTITVHLPDGFDPSSYQVGDEVEFIATLNSDGSYTAVGSSDENDAEDANDSSDDQGDVGDDEYETVDDNFDDSPDEVEPGDTDALSGDDGYDNSSGD
jgi:hypothetical protein